MLKLLEDLAKEIKIRERETAKALQTEEKERERERKRERKSEDKTQYVDSSKPYKYIPPKRLG